MLLRHMGSFRGIANEHFYHRVALPDGTMTPGTLCPVEMAHLYHLDTYDFKGKTVLDMATWSGGWAFYAESRGAKLVTGMDRTLCRCGGTEAFHLIKEELKSKVLYVEGNIYDMWRLVPAGSYDVVFCFGLLYHLSDPMFALRNCVHAAKRDIFIETVAREAETAYLELLPPGAFWKDISNVYSPTTGWLKATMKHLGWDCVQQGYTMPPGSIDAAHATPEAPRGLCRIAMHFVPSAKPAPTWNWVVYPHPNAY